MNVTGDLAEKILRADLLGENAALPSISAELASQLRAIELMKRHCRCGELTDEEWRDVHLVYPDYFPGQPFALSSEPSRKKLSAAYLAELGKRYERTPRQVRRYFDEGGPIDDPIALAAWWEAERAAGRKSWSLPDGIAKAAEAVRLAQPSAPTEGPEPIDARLSGSAPPVPDEKKTDKKGATINLEDYDEEEGDRLRDLKRLRAARWEELSDRLKEGLDGTAQERALIKLEDMISRIETRIEERLKKKGLFIPEATVKRDLAKAIDLIHQMSHSEARRVVELCPSLTAEMKTQVVDAVLKVGKMRANIFRNLKNVNSVEDAVRDIAAA